VHSILETILAPKSLWGSFLLLFVGGLSFYPLAAGTSYLHYHVLRKKRFFPGEERENDRGQIVEEWRWTFYNVLGNAVLTAPVHHLIVEGHSRVYFDVAERGLPYLFCSVAAVLVFTEIAVYWVHRGLHHPAVYRHIHLPHHRFRVPSPWTSLAFHPLDGFAQALPHHLCAFLFPVHVGVYAFFVVFLQIWSTAIHERVSFVRWGFINYTAHHTLHHKMNKHNYGQFFTVCDRIFGTYKDPAGLVYDGGRRAAVGPRGGRLASPLRARQSPARFTP
jgi:lathosterol oxidase